MNFQEMVKQAGNIHQIMAFVAQATDAELSFAERQEALSQIASASHRHQLFREIAETFRDIANKEADCAPVSVKEWQCPVCGHTTRYGIEIPMVWGANKGECSCCGER